jgi:HK97 family phage portal protein
MAKQASWWDRWTGGLFKSIPVIPRMADSDFQFLGTTRSTLSQILNRAVNTDPYASHAWVRGAIEAVALNISSTPLMWKNSREKQASEQDSAKWVKLFDKPNDQMSQQDLFVATLVYMLHYGECMWVLDRQEPTAMPKAIEPFNGQLFEPVRSKSERIVGWKIDVKGENGATKEMKFQLWEVCHFKLFNPYDKERGLSPLQAAQLGIDQDELASQYNKAFFANSALPGGVIEVEDELTDEAFQRMKQQVMDHHQGVSKAHTLAILEGGAKYKQLVPSQKDMEFLNQKKWNRDEILACFKVPKLELGIWDDVNFAVAKVQAREFWVKTLAPKMKLLEWVMYHSLFSVTGTGKVYADFDTSKIEALQGDMVEKVDMAFKLWQMGYPANVLNERFSLSLPKIVNGDAVYVMNNVNQVDATGKIVVPVDPNAKAKAEAKPAAKKSEE